MAGEPTLVQRYRSARRDRSCVVLEGFQPLKHGARFGARILHIVVTDEERFGRLCATLAPDLPDLLKLSPVVVDDTLFSRLAPAPPSTGVLAIARRPTSSVEQALAGDAPVVFLESPARLENIGASVRVAAAAGAAALLTSGPHDPWHPSAVRVGVGLHYAIEVAAVGELPATDRPVLALDPEAETVLSADPSKRRASLARNSILAFGSERAGLSASILERATERVRIPMREGVSSLNLATAVAVALYALERD